MPAAFGDGRAAYEGPRELGDFGGRSGGTLRDCIRRLNQIGERSIGKKLIRFPCLSLCLAGSRGRTR